ncbi:hypothetical protein BD311DRAFT_146903 [Dichomitus squalens]|uniref:Uncharacterized protein n=1 Tax=Dichomitus squalens TaxID=114155 RepID=A0A4Q9MWM2_9APHY|nr:hypothetical protein BD311DRAFT_146903 [Dichomitus squalens]
MNTQSKKDVSPAAPYQLGHIATRLPGHVADLLLTTGLYGVFFTCVFLSVIVLTRNGLRRWPTTTLLCVVGVMFVVTTIHWAASMLNVLDELDLVICDSGIPCVSGDESQTCPPLILQPSGRDRLPLQYCAWSAALTTNVAVFGSIVYCYGMH